MGPATGATPGGTDATDRTADVKNTRTKPDEKAIAGIVKYCGPSLENRDAALVSFTDKDELKRVREGFLKKKLGLTKPDAELDKAIEVVGGKIEEGPHQEPGHRLLPAGGAFREAAVAQLSADR